MGGNQFSFKAQPCFSPLPPFLRVEAVCRLRAESIALDLVQSRGNRQSAFRREPIRAHHV